jgi:hypothetical protein
MKGEGGDEMMAPEGKGAGGKPQRPDRPRRRPPGDEAGGGGSSAPLTLGGQAPAFELTKLDGKPVQLSSLNGRVGVIVFGSYSSPSFRQHAAQLESLSKQYGSRASFLVVYTKEATPPASGTSIATRRKASSVEAAKDAAARMAQAEKAKESLGLTIPSPPTAWTTPSPPPTAPSPTARSCSRATARSSPASSGWIPTAWNAESNRR